VRRPPPEAERRFEALWQDHSPAVLRYARRRVHPDDVEEVLAETFVVAWRRLDDVPAFALPWLLGVARHVAANTRRSGLRRDALSQRVGGCAVPAAHADEEDGRAVAALALLREADRELLTLLAWDGLTSEEAAEALGCSRGALAVRLHRARKRFAAIFTADADPPRAAPPSRSSAPMPAGGHS
jgi:RNA polymerase sigma-70 factor (ECF subfamily)